MQSGYIHFSGPEELREHWDALTQLYLDKKMTPGQKEIPDYCVKALNTFDTLIFGGENEKHKLLQAVCKQPGSAKEFTHKLSPIANDLCELALITSQYGARGGGRKLQDRVIAEFAKYWTESEKMYGLYPPVSIRGNGDEEIISGRRENLLKSSQGGFLYNFLRATANGVIEYNIARATAIAEAKGAGENDFQDNIRKHAERAFNNSLFAYDLEKNTKFGNFVNMYFDSFFFKNLNKWIHRHEDVEFKTIHMDAPLSHDNDAETIADRNLELQTGADAIYQEFAQLERANKFKIARKVLNGLDERTKKIIIEYEGLNGAAGKTLEELGQDLGITRERVRQLKEMGLRQIKQKALESFNNATDIEPLQRGQKWQDKVTKKISQKQREDFDNSVDLSSAKRPPLGENHEVVSAREILAHWGITKEYYPEVIRVLEQLRTKKIELVANNLSLPRDSEEVINKVSEDYIDVRHQSNNVNKYSVHRGAFADVETEVDKLSIALKRKARAKNTAYILHR